MKGSLWYGESYRNTTTKGTLIMSCTFNLPHQDPIRYSLKKR